MIRFYVAASMAIAIAASGLALWLAAGRGGRPPLISVRHGLRHCRLRHALHGDGRGDALSLRHDVRPARRRCRPTFSPSSSPSSRSAFPEFSCCCCCRIRLARHRGARVVEGGASAVTGRRRRSAPPPSASASAAAAPSDTPEFGRGDLCAARRRRRAAAALCPPSADRARRRHAFPAPWKTWSPSMPTRITRISSTATTSCFVRSPSATSNRGSTIAALCAFIAATSSISIGSSAINAPATTNWSSWRRRQPLCGAGQPQPHRLAEIARRRADRDRSRAGVAPPPSFRSAIDQSAMSVDCVSRH